MADAYDVTFDRIEYDGSAPWASRLYFTNADGQTRRVCTHDVERLPAGTFCAYDLMRLVENWHAQPEPRQPVSASLFPAVRVHGEAEFFPRPAFDAVWPADDYDGTDYAVHADGNYSSARAHDWAWRQA